MQRSQRTQTLTLTLEVTGDQNTHNMFYELHGRIVDTITALESRREANENCVVHARLETFDHHIHTDSTNPF